MIQNITLFYTIVMLQHFLFAHFATFPIYTANEYI